MINFTPCVFAMAYAGTNNDILTYISSVIAKVYILVYQ